MNSKNNFHLNEDARSKINNEYLEQKKGVRPQRPGLQLQRVARAPQSSPYIPDFEDLDDEGFEEVKPRRRGRKAKFIFVTVMVCAVVIILNLAFLLFRGKIWFNEPRKREYPVRGAVITDSLATVDWKRMSQQNISFVYIRATKGTTYIDKEYEDNRKGSAKTNLLVGYYHQFDFTADGKAQAENYINTCGDLDGKLRPVVKVTKYGVYNLHLKESVNVLPRLEEYLDAIKKHYGKHAVIMCDKACYEEYIKGNFEKNKIWMVDHFSEPDEETNWVLWEYNPRVRTAGYENKKKYYALTVFRKEKSLSSFKKIFMM